MYRIPRQYEFARLNLTYTLMSKHKLLELVTTGIVSGWDDPRMPTICGFRRRGYTPESIKALLQRDRCSKSGQYGSGTSAALPEEELNRTAGVEWLCCVLLGGP